MFAENKNEMAEQNKLIPVAIGEQTQWLKADMCQQLRDFSCALIFDGKDVTGLHFVIGATFGVEDLPIGNCKYYAASVGRGIGKWSGWNEMPESIMDFYPISAFFAEPEPEQVVPVVEGKRELSKDEMRAALELSEQQTNGQIALSNKEKEWWFYGYCANAKSLPSSE